MSKSMKTRIRNLIEKNVVLRRSARRVLKWKGQFFYYLKSIGKRTDSNMIVFSTFGGRAYACSPKAIYEYMIKQEQYKNFQYIWAFSEPDKYQFLTKNKNTYIVKYGSKEYEESMIKAKYWITNFKIADYIYPKKDQIYLQCWHGTPLKKLGYDLHNTENAMNSQKEIHEKYKNDASKFHYILSQSKFATEKIISAWNLKKIHKENTTVELGYPRNDFLFNYTEEDTKKIKEELSLPKNKKVILYAPTWRDNQHKTGVGYTYNPEIDFDFLSEQLNKEYIILFRAHYLIANSFNFEQYKGFIYDVSKVDDINKLYIISDILITDYSSVFFDFSNLKRPIIFYMYDFKKYEEQLRGFYIDISELPGKITKNENELLEAIEKTKQFQFDENYKKFNEKYNYLDDGNATKRVVEKIIKKE